ncbi:hypothetical protein EDB19DRAFT_1952622 [Suillus lakei]|nr:hypothetical protein EDB19DRAFT_1952622 [Suillus lakei]
MVECLGCYRNDLSVTSLSQHLSKTKDARCNAVLTASRTNLRIPSPPPYNDVDAQNLEDGLFQPFDEEPQEPHDKSSSNEENTAEEPKWEPPVQEDNGDIPGSKLDDPMDDNSTDRETRQHVESYGSSINDAEKPYSPFSSRMDWEIAQWAKLHGPTSTAFSDLLSIGGVSECLNLSYKNSRELNSIINKQLPGHPKFHREQIIVAGEPFDIYYRDVMECIKELYGDPDFADYLVFTPEHHYTDDNKTVQLYSDMHTGTWWWNSQKKLDKQWPGATVIPVVISTNKTQVTTFHNKTAYPVYPTIGNIPKEICRKPSRHAHVLLAYLPTTCLEHITNKASCRRSTANLYHACMAHVLLPLENAGLDGLAMHSGDGISCHCHPLFACFVGDYPKQVLTSAIKTTECPKCDIPPNELESSTAAFEIRDLNNVLDALATTDVRDLKFIQACRDAGIKPVVHPFWERLPYANIFQAITPNILHQLYQGLALPAPPRVSGAEHAQICCFILSIIIDARLPSNLSSVHLLHAVHGLLDFLYLAQYPCHSSGTLSLLNEALALFHDNKQIFVDLSIQNHFNFPKLHATRHYISMIRLYGTMDNYNTEYTERLHIDLAKDAYHTTNHKDEFAQMTQWLKRKEKIIHHEKFIHARAVSFQHLISDYGATYFREALTQYVVQQNHLDKPLSHRRLEDLAANVLLPFHSVAVYHKIKWLSVDSRGHGDPLVMVDSVHVKPHRTGTRQQNDALPARFDTALINDSTGQSVGVEVYNNLHFAGYRVYVHLPLTCDKLSDLDVLHQYWSGGPPSRRGAE